MGRNGQSGHSGNKKTQGLLWLMQSQAAPPNYFFSSNFVVFTRVMIRYGLWWCKGLNLEFYSIKHENLFAGIHYGIYPCPHPQSVIVVPTNNKLQNKEHVSCKSTMFKPQNHTAGGLSTRHPRNEFCVQVEMTLGRDVLSVFEQQQGGLEAERAGEQHHTLEECGSPVICRAPWRYYL